MPSGTRPSAWSLSLSLQLTPLLLPLRQYMIRPICPQPPLRSASRVGRPNPLYEAMSLSIPTIVSDIPGNRDLILPGQMGLLAPAQDAKALSEAIRWMPRIPRSGEPWGDRGVSASLETLVLRLTRGFSLVFSARSPRRRISVRRAPNFRAHGNLFLCAQKNISVCTKISRLPHGTLTLCSQDETVV